MVPWSCANAMTDEEVDPFTRCGNCGKTLALGVSHPVTTRYDDDGELQLYSFCDGDCQREWNDDGEPEGEPGDQPPEDTGV